MASSIAIIYAVRIYLGSSISVSMLTPKAVFEFGLDASVERNVRFF